MRRIPLMLLLIGLAMLSACATQPRTETPFSERWMREQRATQELERRREFIQGDQTADSVLRVDERGRPRLGVGGLDGLSADIDYDHGTSASVKYRWRWNFVRPEHRGKAIAP